MDFERKNKVSTRDVYWGDMAQKEFISGIVPICRDRRLRRCGPLCALCRDGFK